MTSSSIPQKQCKDCGESFPIDKDHFYFHHGYFDTRCKACYSIKYGHKPNKKYPDGFWECNTCKKLLPLTAEYFTPYKARNHGFRYQCLKCNNAQNYDRYHENKDEINARARDRLKTDIEYRDRKRQIARESQSKRKDKTRIYNQEWQQKNWQAILEYKKQWGKDNPDKVRYSRRVYRLVRTARIRGNGGKATVKQIKELYNNQDGKCRWCGIDTNGKYHIDHIHPVSKGGSSDIENLCISCKKCNQLKSNLTVEQWIIKLSKIRQF